MNIKAKRIITAASRAALFGLLTVAPFAILELRNRPASGNFSQFPYPLFIFLWLLSIALMITGAPIVRTLRAGDSLMAHPLSFRIVFLVLFAIAWAGIVRDQMPCFLGVPNCD